MSRWLLHLKILGRNDRNLFLRFFVAHLQYLKDFRLVLPLSLQGIDIGLDRQRGRCRRGRSRGFGFSRTYSLGARISSSWSTSGIVALVGAVALLPAAEAESFFDASRSLCGS